MIIITMSLIYLMIWFIQLIILIFCVGVAVRIIQLQNYNPMIEDSYTIDLEKVDKWIGDGAKPSSTVNSLIKKARKSAASE